eukprot:CAMPEP_0119093582 /NCGR_PEP_ID=MMETSP1178-20130426/163577_1 /TAXON_ID=33656 /ORGANISM="unid sp, Strain CCMP2000" /LENGTH=63 /DNA_ID=CAMNT_0007077247 /DNA_START=63 /DNA_END=250 /DNA_ORIENTATION=+
MRQNDTGWQSAARGFGRKRSLIAIGDPASHLSRSRHGTCLGFRARGRGGSSGAPSAAAAAAAA